MSKIEIIQWPIRIKSFRLQKISCRRITIELEEGQLGAYRIMRDSMVIEEKKFDYNDVD